MTEDAKSICTESLRKTPIYNSHIELKAHMVPFAGYLMPIEYEGILKEAQTVRTTGGLFDLSHMGEIEISGKDSLEFLQKILTNDLSILKEGQVQYNVACNHNGKIIDDLMVYKLSKDKYMAVVNASNADTMLSWFLSLKEHEAAGIIDKTEETALVALQGPLSEKLLQNININLSDLFYMNCQYTKINKFNVLTSRTGYTGEDGFEFYCSSRDAEQFWNFLLNEAKKLGIKPIGLGARDILRLEMCYTLYGNDIDLSVSPIEASLEWAVSDLKGEYIGKEKLAEEKKKGPAKKLIAFRMVDKGFPRQHYVIYSAKNEEIGAVTSGAFSPNTNEFIGMGYLKSDFAAFDTEIFIDIRGKKYKAKVCKKPFLQYRVKKQTK